MRTKTSAGKRPGPMQMMATSGRMRGDRKRRHSSEAVINIGHPNAKINFMTSYSAEDNINCNPVDAEEGWILSCKYQGSTKKILVLAEHVDSDEEDTPEEKSMVWVEFDATDAINEAVKIKLAKNIEQLDTQLAENALLLAKIEDLTSRMLENRTCDSMDFVPRKGLSEIASRPNWTLTKSPSASNPVPISPVQAPEESEGYEQNDLLMMQAEMETDDLPLAQAPQAPMSPVRRPRDIQCPDAPRRECSLLCSENLTIEESTITEVDSVQVIWKHQVVRHVSIGGRNAVVFTSADDPEKTMTMWKTHVSIKVWRETPQLHLSGNLIFP